MKHLLTILFGVMLSLPLSAQTEGSEVELVDSVSALEMMGEPVDGDYTGITLWRPSYYGMPSYTYGLPTMIPVYHPSFYGPHYMDLWDIHKGLNASVDMGVSVGFGKNNPWKGAHSFTTVTALYAYPVNDRLTLAAGMDYSTFTGWGRGHSSVGLFGLANYRINERLDVTGFVEHDFGQLSGVRSCTSPLPPFFDGPRTTVGADLGIKVGENAKINLGVSFTREQGGPFGPPVDMRPQQNEFPGRDWQRHGQP